MTDKPFDLSAQGNSKIRTLSICLQGGYRLRIVGELREVETVALSANCWNWPADLAHALKVQKNWNNLKGTLLGDMCRTWYASTGATVVSAEPLVRSVATDLSQGPRGFYKFFF